MGSRYTSSDIEIHMSRMTENMPTEGLDVEASEAKAGQLVQEAIETAYPQYSVSVFTGQSQWGSVNVVGYPDDVEPEALEQIAEMALGDIGEGRWYVLATEGETTASAEYGFVMSQPDGEIYAVEFAADGTITGACGPLYYAEVIAAELPNFHYHDRPELPDWLMSEHFAGEKASYHLMTDDEIERCEISAQTGRHTETETAQ